MPEEPIIFSGTEFDAEEGVQTIYGSIFSYGDLATSSSVVLTPTGSLPSPSNSINGQIVNYQASTTGSLYFFNGITWKQIILAP